MRRAIIALSLYRKWRPQDFDEVFGQEHIKTILINALESQKISHAYLFAGPRGVGKTTVARILAKNLNCLQLVDGKSCKKCLMCQSYSKGENMDLIEIDAASNRGIDEVRELIEKIKFVPTQSKYKIFIIDEAHMLTKEAWNALLKTLEEPPAHAVFVLVTTEAHKIPATIHSRCQRLDFHRINTADMTARLNEIAKKEKLQIHESALSEIVRNAKGGMRDAISLLDQIQTFVGNKITLQDIELLLGVTNKKTTEEFLKNLYTSQKQASFLQIEKILEEGVDLERFIEEVINLLRLGLKIKFNLDEQLIAEYGKDRISELKIYFSDFKVGKMLKILQALIQVKRMTKNSDIVELPLELAILELDEFQAEQISSLKQPDKDFHKKNIQQSPKTLTSDAKNPGESTDFNQIKDKWLMVLDKLKSQNHSLFSLVKSMVPLNIDDNQLILGTNFKFYKERIMQTRNKEIVCQVFQDVFTAPIGMQVKIMTPDDKLASNKTQQDLNTKQQKGEEKFLENVKEVFEDE